MTAVTVALKLRVGGLKTPCNWPYRAGICNQALWGACGIDCEFCSGCDNRGGGRVEAIYQPYIDGEKEIREITAEYSAPFVRG